MSLRYKSGIRVRYFVSSLIVFCSFFLCLDDQDYDLTQSFISSVYQVYATFDSLLLE